MKKLILSFLLFVTTTIAFSQTRGDNGTYLLTTDTLITYRFLGGNSAACFFDLSAFSGTSVEISIYVANDVNSITPRTEPSHSKFVLLDPALTFTCTSDTAGGFWIDAPMPWDYIGIKFDFTAATVSNVAWKFIYR